MSGPGVRRATLIATAFLCLLALTPSAHADHRREYHWDRNFPTATAVAQIYVEDFTGPSWPVGSMVLQWQ